MGNTLDDAVGGEHIAFIWYSGESLARRADGDARQVGGDARQMGCIATCIARQTVLQGEQKYCKVNRECCKTDGVALQHVLQGKWCCKASRSIAK